MSAIHVASGGHGNNPGGSKCAAEWRFHLCRCEKCNAARAEGTLLTGRPPCAPDTIAHAIPVVNDRLTQAGRDRLASRIPLIPSIAPDAEPAVVERVERLVALWCARSVEHLSDDPRVKACNDTTERWLAGEASDAERAGAAGAARAAWAAGAAWALDDALLDWLDRLLEVWNKTAAAEGLLGSCDWLDPDAFVQAGGS